MNDSNNDNNANKGKIMPELIECQKDINVASDDDEDREEKEEEEEGKEEKRKEEATDKDIPRLINRINHGSDINSDSEEKATNNQTSKAPMTITSGFLSGWNGIFTDSNEGDDYVDEEDDNTLMNYNRNPTIQLTKGKKHKRDSKKKNKPPHIINPAIKYQNNNNNKRKKVKPTTTKPKISTSNKDSTNNESDDTIPRLQNRGHEDSSSKDDSDYNSGDNEVGHKKTAVMRNVTSMIEITNKKININTS